MDAIKEAIARHGNVWTLDANMEMEKLHEPLHAERVANFQDTVKTEKLKYGSNDRHRIDLYAPISNATSPLPVVVFFHGGGFVAGDNDISSSMHGNIGRYFASNGCICALATYRLLPEARYPSGAEDVAQALKWVQDNIRKYNGNLSGIVAIGQSAGGAHLASSIFTGMLKKNDVKLAGTILLSPPMWYDLQLVRRRKNMILYHGSEETAMAKTNVAVFRDTPVEDISPGNLLLMLAEYDFEECVRGNLMFVDEYRTKMKKLPLLEVMEDHNHISYALGIGLPGEKVGPRILRFVQDAQP